ncbi:MAG TPA: hypothetical protein VIS74_02055, partial [Chthoniobacterales bacterium]
SSLIAYLRGAWNQGKAGGSMGCGWGGGAPGDFGIEAEPVNPSAKGTNADDAGRTCVRAINLRRITRLMGQVMNKNITLRLFDFSTGTPL